MRIISWNCSGKLRDKFKLLLRLNADLIVAQECENPKKYPGSDYSSFASNSLWIGNNQNKGLGIFAKEGIKLEKQDWKAYCLRYFLPVSVNNQFNLLAVWACRPYIEEYYTYHCINEAKYNDRTIVIGDFNSNAIWDKKHPGRNQTAVIEKFNKIGITSAYHSLTKEKYGAETKNTFFLYRHKDRGYHIDYAFLKYSEIKDFKICGEESWLNFSDHKPIILDTTAFI